MSASILDSTKKILGLEADDTAFDLDIITFINSIFADLNQLGVGPDLGFAIADSTTLWTDYLDTSLLFNSVQVYIYLRVRLLFDPPTTSYLITSLKEQQKALEWRINVLREGVSWTAPT